MSKKLQIIAVDVGNNELKYCNSDGKNISLPSKITNGYDPFLQLEAVKVEYGDNVYSVGYGTEVTGQNRYFNEYFYIWLLMMIGLSSSDQHIECHLSLGMPVENYTQDEGKFRKSVYENLLGLQDKLIKINDVTKIISIKEVTIWYEGGILTSLDPSLYENNRLLVVDIGGFTIDTILFVGGKRHQSMTLTTKGLLSLKADIQKAFNKDNSCNISNSEELLKAVMGSGTYSLFKGEVSVAKYREMTKRHVISIYNELNQIYSLSDSRILFIGGGSICLRNDILNPQVIVNLNVTVNSNQYINLETYKSIAEVEQFNSER